MEPEPYRGPFVVLAADPLGFRVSVEPPLRGDDYAQTFATKDAAWSAARDLWTSLHAPLRDLTNHNTVRAAEK